MLHPYLPLTASCFSVPTAAVVEVLLTALYCDRYIPIQKFLCMLLRKLGLIIMFTAHKKLWIPVRRRGVKLDLV